MIYDDDDYVTDKERRISRALAVAMHVGFILLLVFGVAWQKRQSEPAGGEAGLEFGADGAEVARAEKGRDVALPVGVEVEAKAGEAEVRAVVPAQLRLALEGLGGFEQVAGGDASPGVAVAREGEDGVGPGLDAAAEHGIHRGERRRHTSGSARLRGGDREPARPAEREDDLLDLRRRPQPAIRSPRPAAS